MKAILLDGSGANDNTGERVRAALTAQLQAQGWDVAHIVLRGKTIGNCGGDFYCWIKHPGTCMLDDDNRAIAEAVVNSDLVVYLTPVTFGSYSATLKRMVDHQMQNVSPFFARVAGETHHAKRYRRNPDFLVVGWMDTPGARIEAIFRHLVQRNALNWHSKTWVGDVVLANQSEEEILTSARQWLDDIRNGKSSLPVDLPASGNPSAEPSTAHGPVEIRRALLLVGSPKARKSTSYSLGGYLFEQLSARDIRTETIYLHTALHSPERTQALLDAVDTADLVTLAFPLYVDALPAPVIEALERIALHREGSAQSRRQLFAAIANCGFPEAYQTATALAICKTFAQQAGFEWAGSLALGGGGMVNGVPLAEGGGMTILMRKSLELAAGGLMEKSAIPKAAKEGLAKPIIPHWLYWVTAWLRWIVDAKGYGALRSLYRRPYLAKAR